MAQKQAETGAAKAGAKKEPAKAAETNEEAANEDGLTPGHINMVMEHTGCTRNEAIGALRESNDDMINAVMKLTK